MDVSTSKGLRSESKMGACLRIFHCKPLQVDESYLIIITFIYSMLDLHLWCYPDPIFSYLIWLNLCHRSSSLLFISSSTKVTFTKPPPFDIFAFLRVKNLVTAFPSEDRRICPVNDVWRLKRHNDLIREGFSKPTAGSWAHMWNVDPMISQV